MTPRASDMGYVTEFHPCDPLCKVLGLHGFEITVRVRKAFMNRIKVSVSRRQNLVNNLRL